jgi:hypothetical protein
MNLLPQTIDQGLISSADPVRERASMLHCNAVRRRRTVG